MAIFSQNICCYCWGMTQAFRGLNSVQSCSFTIILFNLVPTDGNLLSFQYLPIITKSAINIRYLSVL